MHHHKCGLTAVGMLEGFGCGHVWEHRDGSARLEHYCPLCGKGPFTFRFEESITLINAKEHDYGR